MSPTMDEVKRRGLAVCQSLADKGLLTAEEMGKLGIKPRATNTKPRSNVISLKDYRDKALIKRRRREEKE